MGGKDIAREEGQPQGSPGLEGKVKNFSKGKNNLKALAVLVGTGAAVAIFREQSAAITGYFRENIPYLSNEAVSLTVDTITNTLTAPLGFLLSSYAHGADLRRKEFFGQVAFAGMWGALRHYVYAGLSNFDEIDAANASIKTSLYSAYFLAYGGIYLKFSEWWHKVCEGDSWLQAAQSIGKDFKEEMRKMWIDPNIQFNFALNIANMFNPWVESRPTVAGVLLIDYNMNIVKHSHKREHGFWQYLKEVLVDRQYQKKES
ncbi:hypothetical protein HYU13_05115 [Candidatus Woesearchaeota archaeon]|nr:hypothetical protein [Candidatus Woesearchaeota archaeon]